VICIQGGLVQGIFCSHRKSTAAVVDWDVSESGEEEDSRITCKTHRNRRTEAHVAIHSVKSLRQLKGSDAEAVLQAAQQEE
jgi:hypothetical protein